jgi:16S rRNA (guanine527-N7)-methyltransferase
LLAEIRAALVAANVDETHIEKLAAYGAIVLETNRSFNLTGAKSVAEFVPHILDSIAIAPSIRGSLVDIGSGGGLPAIPLAIVTGVSVTMVETTLKKARFLEKVLAELGLVGTVVAERAEIAAHDPALREKFATGTARAVSAAPTVAELLLPFIAIGGQAVLQRGGIDTREYNALADASLILGGQVVTQAPKSSKSVIVVEKKTKTPTKYPRRVGIPAKNPLCF